MFDTGILLIPSPTPSGFAGGGAVLPLSPPPAPTPGGYAVGGVPLPEQPTVATAPRVMGASLPTGSLFALTFSNPSTTTRTALADGTSVSLTFALFGGRMVRGLVRLASTTTVTSSGGGAISIPRVFGGTVFFNSGGTPMTTLLVTITLLQPISL